MPFLDTKLQISLYRTTVCHPWTRPFSNQNIILLSELPISIHYMKSLSKIILSYHLTGILFYQWFNSLDGSGL